MAPGNLAPESGAGFIGKTLSGLALVPIARRLAGRGAVI